MASHRPKPPKKYGIVKNIHFFVRIKIIIIIIINMSIGIPGLL